MLNLGNFKTCLFIFLPSFLISLILVLVILELFMVAHSSLETAEILVVIKPLFNIFANPLVFGLIIYIFFSSFVSTFNTYFFLESKFANIVLICLASIRLETIKFFFSESLTFISAIVWPALNGTK